METTGLKRKYLLKTGQNGSRSKFAGKTGCDVKKGKNPVVNGMYGHRWVKIFRFIALSLKGGMSLCILALKHFYRAPSVRSMG